MEEKKRENVIEKGRRGKEKEKMGSRVKKMQNRKELWQKGHDRSQKTTFRKMGKQYHFQKGAEEE